MTAVVTDVLDDSRLLQLAAEPPHDLFPVLNHSRAFGPLVLALALLPGMVMLAIPATDTMSHWWALRGWDLSQHAKSPLDWLAATGDESNPWSQHPPWTAWMASLAFQFTGPKWIGLTSYFAGAAAVWSLFVTAKSLAGSRYALFAAVLLSTHGEMLSGVRAPGPAAWELWFSLLTVGGYGLHHAANRRGLSFWLVVSSISLGCLSLVCGPVSLILWAAMVLGEISFRDPRGLCPRTAAGIPWGDLLLIGGVALLIGGWWFIWRAVPNDVVWQAWWSGNSNVGKNAFEFWASVDKDLLSTAQVHHWFIWWAPLSGAVLTGATRVVDEIRHPDGERSRRLAKLLWWWGALGFVMWSSATPAIHELSTATQTWQTFLTAPGILLAALGFEETCCRRVTSKTALLSTLFTISALIWSATSSADARRLFWEVAVISACVAIPWGIVLWQSRRGNQEKLNCRWLQTFVISLLILQWFWTWGLLSVAQPEVSRLRHIEQRFRGLPTVDRVVILCPSVIAPATDSYSEPPNTDLEVIRPPLELPHPHVVPPQLLWLVESRWPKAAVSLLEQSPLPGPPDLAAGETGVLMVWTRHEFRPPADWESTTRLTQATEPILYRDRNVVTWLSEPKVVAPR